MTQPTTPSVYSRPVGDAATVERLKRAQVALAYIIMRHGPAYAPLFDRIERELAAAERADSVENRARRVLEDQCVDVTSKAILVSQ